MRRWRAWSMLLAWSVAAAGCGTPTSAPRVHLTKYEQIGPSDSPAKVLSDVTTYLADNISGADVGQTFGVVDANVPYPDSDWSFANGGIDLRWNGGAPSPLEKYLSLADPAHLAAGKSWEQQFHGSGFPSASVWFGHSEAWAVSAMLNPPVIHGVDAKSDGQGGVVACDAGAAGCTRFEIGDLNGLAAEAYVSANLDYIGSRCDKGSTPAELPRSATGRIGSLGNFCQGQNAGTLLVTLGNLLKAQQQPFAMDPQSDFSTERLWNQPVYRYHVYRYEALTEAEAANLVSSGKRDGPLVRYQSDDFAKGFAFVDIGVQWVAENGPNVSFVPGLASTRETRFTAVIEMDAAASDYDATVLGGQFLDDPAVGSDRITHFPYVWIARSARDPSAGPGHRNPFVDPALVRQLIALGQQP